MRTKAESFRYVDLEGLRLSHAAKFHILVSGESLLLELRLRNRPIVAFLFNRFPKQKVRLKQEIIAVKTCPIESYPLSKEEIDVLVPVSTVDRFPARDYWKITSSYGEDFFWCSDDLRFEIMPHRNGCTVYLRTWGGEEVAFFPMSKRLSDDEKVLDYALLLRKVFHIQQQIRVESFLHERQRICWYIPSRLART